MANKMTKEQVTEMCENAGKLGFRPDRLMMLDRRLEEWKDTPEVPSIVIRILRHGQLAFEGAYGILGPGMEPDSLTPDTIFPMCSLTKPVVGVLISIAQEEGFFDINDPVRKYIPELTGDEKSLIRIWHLLTHSSGLIDEDMHKQYEKYVKEKMGLDMPGDDATVEAWDELAGKVRESLGLPPMDPGQKMRHLTELAVILAAPPTHLPQKVMSYCNTGFQMLVDIITRVSGQSIDAFAGEKLFKPLGMKDSHFLFPREKAPRYVTRGPDIEGSGWLNERIFNSESGAGGLKSTAGDMTRFGQMVLNGGRLDGVRILSRPSVREIISDYNVKLPPTEYEGQFYESTWGLGWNVKGIKKDDGGCLRSPQSFEHGGYGGVSLVCDPEEDLVIAYFVVDKTGAYTTKARLVDMVVGSIDD
jgi:serine-type D-Ala-D-Ala carboxypeptidase